MAIHTITDLNSNQPKQAEPVRAEPQIGEFELPELQRTLKLAGLLQTSLEVENILQYFIDSIQEVIPFGGVKYAFADMSLEFHFGKAERHSCTYRLKIAGDELGEIKFLRNKRFTEAEMESLEHMIFHLVYPLRNSIQYQKAVRAAQMDGLTGVYNRAAMDRSLEREVELSHRLDNQISLLIVDVDHFKNINDSYGHSAGDAVLKSLVACINDTMRVSDMLFRYGGEEFALILAGTDMDGARQVGERIRAAVAAKTVVYNGRELGLTVSIGAATLGRRDSAKRLFNKADNALYQAKKAGRNQVHGSNEGR